MICSQDVSHALYHIEHVNAAMRVRHSSSISSHAPACLPISYQRRLKPHAIFGRTRTDQQHDSRSRCCVTTIQRPCAVHKTQRSTTFDSSFLNIHQLLDRHISRAHLSVAMNDTIQIKAEEASLCTHSAQSVEASVPPPVYQQQTPATAQSASISYSDLTAGEMAVLFTV